MTLQEIFNKIVVHLRTQKVPAINCGSDVCSYRTDNNLQCAIGCLIKQEEYDKNMEGQNIYRLRENYPFLSLFSELESNKLSLLADMQCIHDRFKPSKWEQQMQCIAHKYFLILPKKL